MDTEKTMIINPTTFMEITINDKKFLMDPEILPKLITGTIDSNFKDIHSYTIGENVSDADLYDMVKLLYKFDPKAPAAIQHLLIEFIDKYYQDPVSELLRVINNTDVTVLYNYFTYGLYGPNFCRRSLRKAAKLLMYSFRVDKLPPYMLINSENVMNIYNIEITCSRIHFAIPSETVLDYASYATFKINNTVNYFRENVWRLLSIFTLCNVCIFEDICGAEISKKLFAYDNFDLMKWIVPVSIVDQVENNIYGSDTDSDAD